MRVRNVSTQRGFTLVEIMVAITLGIILLGGTIQIYATSKNGYRLQDGIASMQENGRYAMHALRENILMAGFPMIADVAPFDPATTTDGDSDRITLRLQSGTDCLGSAVTAADGIAVNELFVDTTTNTLSCRGNGNNTAQALVENIEAMQILYGVDDDGDAVANRYVTATEVQGGVINPGSPDWNSIVSVRIALLARSSNAIGPVESRDYVLLDANPINRNDAFAHRVFTTTVPLRNRIP